MQLKPLVITPRTNKLRVPQNTNDNMLFGCNIDYRARNISWGLVIYLSIVRNNTRLMGALKREVILRVV